MIALTTLLLVTGAVFMLLAAGGLLRMPDLLLRMSATSKAATLGATLMLLGAAAHFGTVAVLGRAVVIAIFLFLTAPLAAHAIGRAGYRRGTPLWPGTRVDEMGTHGELARPPRTAAGRTDAQEPRRP